jgi:pectate lyase
LLASATFASETSSGWQQQSLPSPLTIAANTVYVVTVNSGGANYAATLNGLAAPVVNQQLSSVAGNNGVYGPPGQFPTMSYQQSDYFRDIVFSADPGSTTGVSQISVVPASISFGNVPVGLTNTQTMTVSNPGSANLSISRATVSGSGFGFNGLTLPLTVAPGKSAAFTVSFAPAAASGATGNLSLINNAPNSPTTIALSGTGVVATVQVTASPTSLSYGNMNVGSSSSKTVTLTNTGNASVSISQISVSGAGFSAGGLTPPLSLTAGQSTTFSVNFAPTATGSVSGSVLVASNATNSPAQIALTGSGVQPTTSTGPLAFPGAQGGGANSVGGRGGTVYEVTNLNDSGTGSLRACVQASEPRTCVFKTGGTIALLSSLTISNPFITIAGQTAPGGGIQISGPSGANAPSNPSFYVRAHDVVIRYLRVRRGFNAGEICNQSPWSCGADVVILSNSSSDNPYNIMIDHVSLEWSDYDGLILLGSNTVTNQPRSVTVSHSIIGEALAGAGQVVGSSSSGYAGQGSVAPDGMNDLDFHHNLFAGTSHRMPLMTVKSGRLVNNFVYGWTYYPMRGKGLRDFVNNYFKTRSGQTAPSHEIQAWTTNDGNDTSFAPSFYVTGNVGPGDPSGTSNWNNMTALSVNESGSEASSPLSTAYQRSSPLPTPAGYVSITADPVSTISSVSGSMLNTARNAPYDGVGASRRLDCAGNWVNAQDSADSRIVNAVANGTTLYGSYDYSSLSASPQSQADLGGWPTLAAGTPCTDSDHDGIPDTWEIAHGLNPDDASDAQKTAPNGYTYLENYLNGIDPNVTASTNSNTSLWAGLFSLGDNVGGADRRAFLRVRKGNHIYRVRQSSGSDLRVMRQR